jgi:hypothetical protein
VSGDDFEVFYTQTAPGSATPQQYILGEVLPD